MIAASNFRGNSLRTGRMCKPCTELLTSTDYAPSTLSVFCLNGCMTVGPFVWRCSEATSVIPAQPNLMRFSRRHLTQIFFLLAACTAGSAQSHQEDSLPDRPSFHAITNQGRVEWVVKGTLGPRSLAIGIFTVGIQTAQNRPREYGPHWDGFGKRYGIRLVDVAVEHTMEASVGALWEEDPRYFRAEEHALPGRIKQI